MCPSGSTPGLILGQRHGPFPGHLTPEVIETYAAATKDPNRGPQMGEAVPPVAVVTQIWDAQQASFARLVPEEVRASMAGGVHGDHDVLLHRPIVPGEQLSTWVEGVGSRRGGRHNIVTMRYSSYDDAGSLVAEQWWTTVLLNALGDPVGAAPPDHELPDQVRQHPIGTYHIEVDDEMPARYAEASRDWSDHHFDDGAARRSGFDRRFLHGLCTMGLCAQSVVSLVASGRPEQVRRCAVRFAAPLYVGEELTVHLYEVDETTVGFEGEAGGRAVIRNGLAQLRS
jgi:acyl dehydratase